MTMTGWLKTDRSVDPAKVKRRWDAKVRPGELLSDAEHELLTSLAECWFSFANIVEGPSVDHDLAEIAAHIHALQQAVMSQAAARAYPDKYRLLGGWPRTLKLPQPKHDTGDDWKH